jgi:aspartyl-tRNA(Asn)/glutamyl-tRNA(Gln) amidotransferase subunit A
LSAEQLVTESLTSIDATKRLNAYLHVAGDTALETARRIDARRAAGEALGPLAGIPIAVKDALCTMDAPTTAGSRILTRDGEDPRTGWRPPYDATVIERLRRADAVIVGKTNMDEFAMGSSNENSAFGPAKNPADETRIPGGSSGGSAVAVASGTAPVALGSDTGGSIRQPASMCGVVGVKPSYGRVSRYGLIAFASSLDQVGPMARDVRSAARVLEVIAGPDGHDSTCAAIPVGEYTKACEHGVRGLKVGIPEEYFAKGIDSSVEAAVRRAIDGLKELGVETQPVRLPHTRYGVATYYIIATAEASSNLSRFDGVRFGLRREAPGADLGALYGDTRDAGFGREVKRRILLGTYVLSAGYYDAYYGKAQRVRTLIKQDFDRAFQQVDLLAAPVAPSTAFLLGERVSDPLSMYLADVYTLPASLAGLCGISVPCRVDEARSLPIGLQLLAPSMHEGTLFRAAAAVEESSGTASPT